MARYDRIAPLSPPPREKAFPGWLALRDLERDERDPELGRRARLHFLAVQPLRRLLTNGIERVPADSLERQIEGVREELGQLPARDAERGHLARFLHHIRQRTPAALVEGSLEMGEMAEETGYRWAAEEFYRTGYELAEAGGHAAGKSAALRRLGWLLHSAGQTEEAADCLGRAGTMALELDNRVEWMRAVEGVASVALGMGQVDRARATLQEALDRSRTWGDARITAAATAALATLELAAGDPDRSIEYGWSALQRTHDSELRGRILIELGKALRRLHLFAAADHAYTLVISAASAPLAWSARAEHALSAAEAGDGAAFDARRAALQRDLETEVTSARVRARGRLRLGQGAALLGRSAEARAELQQARALSRRKSFPEVQAALAELLPTVSAADGGAIVALPRAQATVPASATQRIAEQVLLLGSLAAPAR